MSKKSRKNHYNKNNKDYYHELKRAMLKADAANPLIQKFSFRRWFYLHHFELSILVFIASMVLMILHYGRPKIDADDLLACQLFQEENKSRWENKFKGGYRIVIVKRTMEDSDLPMQLTDLGNVMQVSELKSMKTTQFKLLFPPINTIPDSVEINWHKMQIDFTDYDPVTNEAPGVNVVITDYYDDPNFGFRPLKMSLNRKVDRAGMINAGDNLQIYLEILGDNGDTLFLLFGLITE